jgi:hypothetical protein
MFVESPIHRWKFVAFPITANGHQSKSVSVRFATIVTIQIS